MMCKVTEKCGGGFPFPLFAFCPLYPHSFHLSFRSLVLSPLRLEAHSLNQLWIWGQSREWVAQSDP